MTAQERAIREAILQALLVPPIGKTGQELATEYNGSRGTLPELTLGELQEHLLTMPEVVQGASITLWVATKLTSGVYHPTPTRRRDWQILRQSTRIAQRLDDEEARACTGVLNLLARRRAHRAAILHLRRQGIDALFDAVLHVMEQLVIRHREPEHSARIQASMLTLGATELTQPKRTALWSTHAAVYWSVHRKSWRAVTQASLVRVFDMLEAAACAIYQAPKQRASKIDLVYLDPDEEVHVIRLWEENSPHTPDNDRTLTELEVQALDLKPPPL